MAASVAAHTPAYKVTHKVITSSERHQIITAIRQRIELAVLTERGFPLEEDAPDLDKLLVCQASRSATFGKDKAAQAIFRDGNSRLPLVSKSTGMSDQHYIPEVLEHIAFNRELYKIAQSLYQTREELAFTAGLEKICYKAPGATKMPKHIDWCPFGEEKNNYPRRWQCVVTIDIDTKAEHAGSLILLQNFEHYATFFGLLCHPKEGLVPFPDVPASWSRFFVLPSNFDSYYLPQLKAYSKLYSRYCRGKDVKLSGLELVFFQLLELKEIELPYPCPVLEWKIMRPKPGQAIFWDQRIPHYSDANKGSKARIACYYSIFPKSDAPKHAVAWVKRQVKELRFSYGREADRLPDKVANPEEMAYFARHPEEAARVAACLRASSRRRALVCLS